MYNERVVSIAISICQQAVRDRHQPLDPTRDPRRTRRTYTRARPREHRPIDNCLSNLQAPVCSHALRHAWSPQAVQSVSPQARVLTSPVDFNGDLFSHPLSQSAAMSESEGMESQAVRLPVAPRIATNCALVSDYGGAHRAGVR